MKYRILPNGETIPILGFGTWRLGGNMHPDTSQDRQVVTAIQTAISLGYTHIDTAEMYGGGHTEELVGEAIRGFNRQNLQIGTKIWQSNLAYGDVFRAMEGSLKRLGVDYVDYYIIHLPSSHIPLEETFRALNRLVEQGLTRHLGVSNFNLAQLKHAQALTQTPLLMSQVPCSLYNRKFIKNGMLDHCRENNLLMAAYSPFERGDLLQNPTLVRLARQYKVDPAQIALYWLTRHPHVIVYMMSLNADHLKENLAALDIEMEAADLDRLEHIEMTHEELWPE